MKTKFFFILLMVISYSISSAETTAQPTPPNRTWAQSLKNKLSLPTAESMGTWLNNVKNDVFTYIKQSMPKTKKDWVLFVIGEGIAEGIMLYKGIKTLTQYHRNDAQEFINFSKDPSVRHIFGYLSPVEKEMVNKEVLQTVCEVMEKTKMEGKAIPHYCPGIRGAWSHGKSHIFIPTQYSNEEAGVANKQEMAFLTAHELGHLHSKDYLRLAAMLIAAPVLTLTAAKTLDKATDIIIDKLIDATKLSKNSIANKILQKIKGGKSRILQNPIVRFLVALCISFAYMKHREKQADLFAAKHGYKEGGKTLFGRLNENPFDRMHPSPKERVKYLDEFKE